MADVEPEVYKSNSIFWIDVDKIQPNPFQPRRDFDEQKLNDLASSIRCYGVLQPLVVTRKEEMTPEGGMIATYELIAGERRLRASKIAGIKVVPAVIRATEDDDKTKLEIAIIENLQREDLTPVDRALAFKRLADEFGFKHGEIANKVGKSREYVTNTVRLLLLPEEIIDSLKAGKLTEGHARSLLMLSDRPQEQAVVHKEILLKKMTVREVERITRKIALDKVRKFDKRLDPTVLDAEEQLTEKLGTRVQIEKREYGGRVVIDYFNNADLSNFLTIVEKGFQMYLDKKFTPAPELADGSSVGLIGETEIAIAPEPVLEVAEDDTTIDDKFLDEQEDLYSIKDFTV